MNSYAISKPALLIEGLKLCKAFAKKNSLPMVTVIPTAPPERLVGDGPYAKMRLTGLYMKGAIWVNLAKCTTPAQGRVISWSFPGNKTDRTAYGVMCHEFGHYVDETLKLPSRRPEWKALRGAKITNYEPVPSEAFAETMRLFLTNSHLLQLGSPMRYRFLTETLGLQPVVDGFFDRVLRENGASEAIIRAATNWATKI